MATTNNAVVVTCGLVNTALTSPPIGSGSVTTQLAFTDGDASSDNYVALTTAATALNSALTLSSGEYGWLQVSNPGPLDVELLVDAGTDLTIGKVPAGQFVLPLGNGVVINGKLASGTQTVGVTVIKSVANV